MSKNNKVIVENLDERMYIGYYRVKVAGSKTETTVSKVTFPANSTMKLDEDVWQTLIKTAKGNNTINNKLQQGRLTVIGGSSDLSEESRSNINHREVSYTNFANIYKTVSDAGGVDNKDFVEHLRKDGIPNFNFYRANMGDSINGDTYNDFVSRLKKEVGAGMHSSGLTIPGFLDAKSVAKLADKPKDDEEDEDSEETASEFSYDAVVEKFAELWDDLLERDQIGKKGPKVGFLKENGLKISGEQRDHAWSLFQEKYPERFQD